MPLSLIPWKLIALMLSWIVVATFTYEHCQEDIVKERAVAQAALDAANKHAQEVSDERNSTVADISSRLVATQNKADQAAKALRDNLASGALRLSIAGSCGGKLPNDPAFASNDHQGRCDIDPDAAQRIVAITERGDHAIEKLNACVDAYNALLESDK